MTYIDRLNAFNQWLETNALPASSQLMFYKLLYVFNRAGWPEYVGVDNLRLMLMTDTKSEKTVIRARDKLVEAGFITYRKGRKGQPNQYSLCKIYCNNYSESASISDSESDSISDSHIKTKTKNYSDSDNAARAEDPLPVSLQEAERYRKNMAAIEDSARRIGLPFAAGDFAMVNRLIADYSSEWVLKAIERTQDRNRTWGVVKGILKSWKLKGGIDDAGTSGRHGADERAGGPGQAVPCDGRQPSRFDNLPGVQRL